VSSKLTRKLRRELTANPKKAAILGLLGLVALYFWAPLVWGWVAKETPDDQPSSFDSATAEAPPAWAQTAEQPASDDEKTTAKHSWEEVAKWIKQDPNTSPAGGFANLRDPFLVPVEEVAEADTDEEEQEKAAATPEPPPPEATPAELGLVLSSTVIGSKRSTAIINGRIFAQGQTIEASKDGQPISFTLVEVHPGKVVLRRADKNFDLTIPRSTASGRIELTGNGR